MSDHISELSLGVENDSVGAGFSTGVDFEGRKDRKFLVGSADGEIEALVVVFRVRVVVTACQTWLGVDLRGELHG